MGYDDGLCAAFNPPSIQIIPLVNPSSHIHSSPTISLDSPNSSHAVNTHTHTHGHTPLLTSIRNEYPSSPLTAHINMGVAPNSSPKKGSKSDKASSQRPRSSFQRSQRSQRHSGDSQRATTANSQSGKGGDSSNKSTKSKSKHNRVRLKPSKRIRTTSLGKRVYTDSSADKTEEQSAASVALADEPGERGEEQAVEGERGRGGEAEASDGTRAAAGHHIGPREEKEKEGFASKSVGKPVTPAVPAHAGQELNEGGSVSDRTTPSVPSASKAKGVGSKRSAKLALLDIPMRTSAHYSHSKRSKQSRQREPESSVDRRNREQAIPHHASNDASPTNDAHNLDNFRPGGRTEAESEEEGDIDRIQLGGSPIILGPSQALGQGMENAETAELERSIRNLRAGRRSHRRDREGRERRRAVEDDEGGRTRLTLSEAEVGMVAEREGNTAMDRQQQSEQNAARSEKTVRGAVSTKKTVRSIGEPWRSLWWDSRAHTSVIPSSTSPPAEGSEAAPRGESNVAPPGLSDAGRQTLVQDSVDTTDQRQKTAEPRVSDPLDTTKEPLFNRLQETLDRSTVEGAGPDSDSGGTRLPSRKKGSDNTEAAGGPGGPPPSSGSSSGDGSDDTTSEDAQGTTAVNPVTPITGPGSFVWSM